MFALRLLNSKTSVSIADGELDLELKYLFLPASFITNGPDCLPSPPQSTDGWTAEHALIPKNSLSVQKEEGDWG